MALLTCELKWRRISPVCKPTRFSARLINNSENHIEEIVLRFVAYKKGDIRFESFSRSYHSIKPTLSQYKDINFVDLGCQEIDHIIVEGTRGCRTGPLSYYTSTAEDCLDIIKILPTDLVKISK